MAVTDAVAAPAAPVRRSRPHFVRLKLRLHRQRLARPGLADRAVRRSASCSASGSPSPGSRSSPCPAWSATAAAALLVAARRRGCWCSAGCSCRWCSSASTRPSTRPGSRCCRCPAARWSTGLFAAALVGVPAIATLVATPGWWIAAGPARRRLGRGWSRPSAWSLGLLLCVAASRAVTSAFATALRSRRVRDLAAVLLAVRGRAARAVPAAGAGRRPARRLGPARRRGRRCVGWTPLGAPYSSGLDVAAGRAWAVPVKLLIVRGRDRRPAVVVVRDAGVGDARRGQRPARRASGPRGGTPVGPARVLRVALPRDRFGALVSREARYWWRETRRRASLITFAVVGIFLPVDDSTVTRRRGRRGDRVLLLFVGALAAVGLANQFGFDGSAYAAERGRRRARPGRAAVPGGRRSRIYVAAAAGSRSPSDRCSSAGRAADPVAARHAGRRVRHGLARGAAVSVLGAYALPDTTNPFAHHRPAAAWPRAC